jgi:hypothetical protein
MKIKVKSLEYMKFIMATHMFLSKRKPSITGKYQMAALNVCLCSLNFSYRVPTADSHKCNQLICITFCMVPLENSDAERVKCLTAIVKFKGK